MEGVSKVAIKFGIIAGLAMGTLYLGIVANYGVGFLVGSRFMYNGTNNINTGEPYTSMEIITCFFSVVMASQGLGMISNPYNAITKGKESAGMIYKIINQIPQIKQNDTTKISPKEIKGHIEFRNVSFNYPSRPKITILKNLNLTIPPGAKIALTGGTGCGKSTVIQLLERFYDPDQGDVFIDGMNLKDINLTSLRNFMGYVGQEPVLFSMSIKANL